MTMGTVRKLTVAVLIVWAVLCTVVVLSYVVESSKLPGVENPFARSELELKLVLQLIILNLPISLVALVLQPVTGEFGGGIIVEAGILIGFGLLQWAIVLPRGILLTQQIIGNLEQRP